MKETVRTFHSEIPDSNEYFTHDINLTAFLLVRGFKFCRSPDKAEKERDLIRFYFSKSEALKEALCEYREHRTAVDALELFDQQRSVRTLAFSIKKGMYEDQTDKHERGNEKRKNDSS